MSEQTYGPYAFTLTKDEFLTYAREVARRQMVEIDAKSWRLSAVAGLAVGAVLGGLGAAGSIDGATLSAGALGSIGAILIGRFMIRRVIARSHVSAIDALAAERAYGDPVTLVFDGDGVSVDMGGRKDRRLFSELRSVQRLGGLLILWFGLNDGLAAPDRALPSAQEADALAAFVSSRVAPSPAAPTAPPPAQIKPIEAPTD
jgi:hypothetical protein